MKNTIQSQKVCFSYIRFSSEGQKDGSSVERQTPIAARVASEKGWTLREDLNAQDLGVSAFKGDNFQTLETIIEAVKSGKIPQGSVMVIEAFDRFSRAELDTAEDLLKKVLRSGLEIYVDRGGHHLTKESLNKPIERIIALLELAAANEYSAKLSERIKKAFSARYRKIAEGEKVKTGHGPFWVNLETFELNERAALVKKVFGDYLKGIGPSILAREFNGSKIPSPGEKGVWQSNSIYRLLKNRQVIGEHQNGTDTVQHYWPSVVSEETFLKAQAKLNDNAGMGKGVTSQSGFIVNLFTGVGFCRCGSAIKVTSGNGGRYVTCRNKIVGLGCEDPMTRYAPIESAFIEILQMNPSVLLRDENGDTASVQSQILAGRLSENQKSIDNITEWVMKGKGSDSLLKKLAELETQNEEIKAQKLIESAKTVSQKGGVEKLADMVKGLDRLTEDNAMRVRVQAWIRENVEQITFFKKEKRFTVNLKNGNEIGYNHDGTLTHCKSFASLFTGQPIADVRKVA